MSPPSATAASRPPPRHSRVGGGRTAARRRRLLLGMSVVAAAVVVFVLAFPLARKAVNELGLPLSYPNVIREQAAEKHLDPALVAAVIYAETKFDPRPSAAGAQGLMQILPQTARFLARRSGATTFKIGDLRHPQVNIAYGSYYLRYLLDEYHGSRVLALAAYNGGETNVDTWIAAARGRGRKLTIDAIPFAETRAYVRRVLQARADYRRTYAAALGYR